MGFAPIRRTRLNQPSGDGIDWSNPLTRGLKLAAVGSMLTNLVTGKAGAVIGAPGMSVNNKGKAFGPFATTSDYFRLDLAQPPVNANYAQTFAFVASPVVTGWQDIFKNGGSYFSRYNFNGGAPEFFPKGQRWGYSGSFFSDVTKAYSVVAVLAEDASTISVFADGQDITSSFFYIGNYGGYPDSVCTIGVDLDDPHAGTGLRVNLVLYWPDTSLSKKEAASLSANPWQVFL